MRLLILAFCFLLSCGAPAPQEENTKPGPVVPPNPKPQPGGKTSFAEAQGIMQKYCAECHAGAAFVKSESGLIGSSAKARVQNASMPPTYADPLPAGDKAKFLNFFSE